MHGAFGASDLRDHFLARKTGVWDDLDMSTWDLMFGLEMLLADEPMYA
jgi:hypothetical protein